MSWIGVITGDIVNSTEILNSGHREKLLEVLHTTVDEIGRNILREDLKMELFRGDSFQILIDNIYFAVDIAVMIRARLIASSLDNIRWDARIGVGIGEREFMSGSVNESDGEAFRNSGKAFDSLKSNNRLAVLTPDEDFNEELEVSTTFADNIISDWTITQAKTIHPFLLRIGATQKEIAKETGASPQVISKRLISSKVSLVSKYTERYAHKMNKLIQIIYN